jgi:hypothetical protein
MADAAPAGASSSASVERRSRRLTADRRLALPPPPRITAGQVPRTRPASILEKRKKMQGVTHPLHSLF